MKKYIPTNDSDDQNPIYMFSLTPNDLLGAIVRGEIDPVELAKQTLENRGLDKKGNWVGFKK
ncbi:TPA: hypothetical protein ACT5CJ_001987 [Flavobacterium psychrophilum]